MFKIINEHHTSYKQLDTDFVTLITGPTCSDGSQNQNETGVDCGGPCDACPTCTDEIQNQGETGIDCGGTCPACREEKTIHYLF